jgi:asparagine N-glycosylation enzyme membrane subunit Stt3
MAKTLFMQFLTLSIYTFFVGFCFCDGFKLHILRKLVWFIAFLALSIYSVRTTNEFDLTLILPISTLIAILLCSYEKNLSKKKKE